MLGAAHVLAMDSKNLLDVVDTIRMRLVSNEAESEGLEGEKLTYPNLPSSPVPVTCTVLPVYTNYVQSAATSSNLSTNPVDS